jgi:hypothetical protein
MWGRLLPASLAAILLAVVAVALPAGAGGQGRVVRQDLGPNLSSALDQLEFAYYHEEDAAAALEAPVRVSGYAEGELEDSQTHLRNALDDLQQAVADGEIDASEASGISDQIKNALSQDGDALFALDLGVKVSRVISFVDDAEHAKEVAANLIEYGTADPFGDLGCTLYRAVVGSDIQVGFDGCTTPLAKIEFLTGFNASNNTSASVVSNGSIVSQFACVRTGSQISCTPPTPIPPGRGVFIAYPAPVPVTAGKALAFGTIGYIQKFDYLAGTGKASTDLGLSTDLKWVTRLGFKSPLDVGGTYRFGVGYRYTFETNVANYGSGTATNARYTLDVPSNFHVDSVFPTSCGLSGNVISCLMGTLPSDYAGTVSIMGTVTGPGTLQFTKQLTSDASEPSPDPHPNSLQFNAKAYGIPNTPIDKISSVLRQGKPGTISGHALPGSSFEPKLEQVKKVEVGILLLAHPHGKCMWLGPRNKLVAIPLHIGACDKGIWLPASGTTHWTFTLTKGLARGQYEFLARGTSTAGLTNIYFGGSGHNALQLNVR